MPVTWGAKYAGASDDSVAHMERFGRSLGMAFQIADDLLDLLGDEADTGKSLGTDLEKQKPTLPLIRLYDTVPADRRGDLELLLQSSDEADRRTLSQWLQQSDALDYARGVATRFADEARGELDHLPTSDAREILSDLTEFVVARST